MEERIIVSEEELEFPLFPPFCRKFWLLANPLYSPL